MWWSVQKAKLLAAMALSLGLLSVCPVSPVQTSVMASTSGQDAEKAETPKLLLPKIERDSGDRISLFLAREPTEGLVVEFCTTLGQWTAVPSWQRDGNQLRVHDPGISDKKMGFYRARPITPATSLELARKKWMALGIDGYQGRFRWTCFCVPEYVEPVLLSVQQDEITDVDYLEREGSPAPGDFSRYVTVNGLFDWIEEALEEEAYAVQVEYHPEFGYPTSGFIDFERNIADEEKGFKFDFWGTPTVLLTERDPESIRKDAVELGSVSVDALTLDVEVAYSGGCRDHFFLVFMSPPVFQESFPPQADLYLRHVSQDDPCEAWIQETKSFDLRLVAQRYRELYQGGGPLRIEVHGFSPNGFHPTQEVSINIPDVATARKTHWKKR